ncbi:MAG: hypothetical protein JXR83_03460 [Deltaproteobacteria bacterium]|nr:hypothetical protein [Deltaproteobacteria bacterium]
MAEVRYTLGPGESPVLRPVVRRCERNGYLLDVGQGGPTGRLEEPPADGTDLFGAVRIASDLAQLAVRELDQMRAAGQSIYRVHVGEVWDLFLGPPEVQAPVIEAIEAIARAGHEVEIRTRAVLPKSAIDRLAAIKERIRVEIPFVSMRPDIAAVWEPGTSTPGERLRCARNLTTLGVRVAGRVDPLLPLINDTQVDIEEFCVAFAGTGMYRATVSYLYMTPGRGRAMSRALSRMHRDILKGCFAGQPWIKDDNGVDRKTLPQDLRERGLRRFLEVAQKNALPVAICGCSDGDVISGGCHNIPQGTPRRRGESQVSVAPERRDGQLDFFAATALARN